MSLQATRDEYLKALKMGQKEADELTAAGKNTNPEVLDELVPEIDTLMMVDLGVIEIPSHRIVGTKTAGRITAFTPSFLPLMSVNTEFAAKWINLCEAHLGPEGIREPIMCYEYLGKFYVQEGNKRVSVLRYFGAPKIPAQVKRVFPAKTEEPEIKAYYEFLEFFKISGVYTVMFRRPNDYGKLMSLLGCEPGVRWSEDERRIFNARIQYFREALDAVNTKQLDILPEEALLLWLKLYPFENLSKFSTAELKKSVASLWEDIVAVKQDAVQLEAKIEESKPGILTKITLPDHVNVAFVQQLNPSSSGWALGHDKGREYLEKTLGDKVTVRSYFQADTPEETERLTELAVSEGASIVFTTVPQMSRITLKLALKYPKVLFFNCSVDQPYRSIRTYYGRIYEAKFISGAVAGAMAQNNRIGYIASYPIYGVPASINAFALGAQMVNPRAQIELRWSCLAGTHQADFFADGIRVISNRDVPIQSKTYLDFCNYGTYLMDDLGELIPLASPVWVWGRFYEQVVRAVLNGTLKKGNDGSGKNYWLGMDSGLIDIEFSERIPEGVRTLITILKQGMISHTIHPFDRRIIAQDGSVKHSASDPVFTADELLHMDWLCENVSGTIPAFDELLPMSKNMVRELGVYREKIPAQKEAKSIEDFVHLR